MSMPSDSAAHLALADRDPCPADPRAQEVPAERDAREHDDVGKGVDPDVRPRGERLEVERRYAEPGAAVGDGVPVGEHPEGRLREGDGGEREVQPPKAQRGHRDREPGDGREADAGDEGEPVVQVQLELEQPGGVRADPEQGRVREGELARVAEQHVEPDREQDVHEGEVADEDDVGVRDERKHREEDEPGRHHVPAREEPPHRGPGPQVSRSLWMPNRPDGRNTSTTMMMMNAETSWRPVWR